VENLPDNRENLIEQILNRTKTIGNIRTIIAGGNDHVGDECQNDDLVSDLGSLVDVESSRHLCNVAGPAELHPVGQLAQPGVRPVDVGIANDQHLFSHRKTGEKMTTRIEFTILNTLTK